MRLNFHHPAYPLIERDLSHEQAGFAGEQHMQYYFRQQNTPSHGYIHQLRLNSSTDFFQIDTLLIHPHAMIIFEIKNITGQLSFDFDRQQLIRSKDGHTDIFADPVRQAFQQKSQLKHWLGKHNITHPPIEAYTVLTNRNAMLDPLPPHPFAKHVLRPVTALDILFNLKPTSEPLFPHAEQLAHLLTCSHQPYVLQPFKRYDIQPSDLHAGVLCPHCPCVVMHYFYGTWHCKTCGKLDASAPVRVLEDYARLFGPYIRLNELVAFLKLPDRFAARRFVKKFNFDTAGRWVKLPVN
ncbi:nuclease-related domain-containing protein [Geomicrobium sp. JSM 1781026]|uniref:nuclease-related domain-containing protein n=1 Tax=Geomicrobium sp. JSM 1781026 TaxID=3344580 RepID=UPI0035C0D317